MSLADVLVAAEAMITNETTGTTITKIVPHASDERKGIYRISTPVPPTPPMLPHGFTFGSFLVVDERPLIFHTGMKSMFPLVKEAVASVIPPETVRHIGYGHYESDECGSMNDWLETAPDAVTFCSRVEGGTNGDMFIRPPSPLADGEQINTGAFTFTWQDTPHTVHGWGSGCMFEETTRTLLCGDLFTQVGDAPPPVRDACPIEDVKLKLFDITDYWCWTSKSQGHIDKLAALEPQMLLPMHGSAFRGAACGDMLRQLGALRASMDAPPAA